MNPLTNVKNINKLNELELTKGLVDKKSWHDLYKDSAWVFIGGLAYGLTEGDILCVFSQYGEIVNVNLVRDKKTGKTKGFCFLCYANQKSTILAVDNLNGIKLCGRTIRVDHVANYKPPKDNEHDDEVTKLLKEEGCAPKPIKLERSPSPSENTSEKKRKKMKKEKKKHKKRKKKSKDSLHIKRKKIKKEKHDPGYDKYEFSHNSSGTSRPTKHKNNNQSESSNSESSSDDEFDLHASHARQSRLGSHDRKIQENSDLPGPSGYQESKKKHENKEKESTKKQKHKNPENYSDEEKSKRRKLQTCNLEKERHYNQPSSSFHNSAQQSFSQSFSDESSDKYSSSPKRRSESRHEISHGHRSKSHSRKDKNSEDTFHKRNRHDSSSSMDNSPTRPVHSKSRDYSTNHSKHTKDLPEKVLHFKNNDTIHDRTSHRYTDEYKKHSSNSYNRERTESYDRTSYLNKSHHYNSERNKER